MANISDFARAAPVVIGAVKAGATIAEAAQRAEIPEGTVKRWLTDGRKQPSETYGNFAFAVDLIRELRESGTSSDEPVDDAEVQLHLSRAIRSGSVQAMKVWVDAYRKSGDDDGKIKPRSIIDELAERRHQASPAHSAPADPGHQRSDL